MNYQSYVLEIRINCRSDEYQEKICDIAIWQFSKTIVLNSIQQNQLLKNLSLVFLQIKFRF